MNMMPIQKTGMEMPNNDNIIVALSLKLLGLVAENIPAKRPTITMMMTEKTVSFKVVGNRTINSSWTGLLDLKDVPKSPLAKLATYFVYCSIRGLSVPKRSLIICTSSGVASSPAIIRAGSPGTAQTSKNANTVTPNKVGINCSNRFPKYLSNSVTPWTLTF